MLKSLKSYWSGSSVSDTATTESSRVSASSDATVTIVSDEPQAKQDEEPSTTAFTEAEAQNTTSSWMAMSMDSAMLTSVLKPDEMRQTFSKARNFFGKLGSVALQKTARILEENTPILSDFSREQSKFELEKQQREAIQTQNSVVPWYGYANEEAVKKQILALTSDKRNFIRSPPSGSQFAFDMNEYAGAAQLMLSEDPSLSRMRFELVPKAVREEIFWRNYFYRVSLIKQSAHLAELATMKPNEAHRSDLDSPRMLLGDPNAAEDAATQLSGSSNTSVSFDKLSDMPQPEADAENDVDGDFVSDSHSLSHTVTLSHDELAQLNLSRAAKKFSGQKLSESEAEALGSRKFKAEDAASGSDWSHDEFELVTEAMQSASGQAESDEIDDELEREILAEIALEEAQK